MLWSPESATGNTPIFNAFISGQKIFKKFTQFLGACSFLLFFRISNWRLKITKKNYSHWRNWGGGGGCYEVAPLSVQFLSFSRSFRENPCQTRMHSSSMRTTCLLPVSPRMRTARVGGRGVYLVLVGVPGPRGCTWSIGGDAPGLGGYLVLGVWCTWSRGYLVPGEST